MNLSLRLSSTRRAWRRIAGATACVALLALPACQIPKLRDADAGAMMPETFKGGATPESTGAESSSRLSIDEFYNDPLLTRVIYQALSDNLELKILNEEVQIARNDILARRGAYLPFVTVDGNVGLDKPTIFTPLGSAERQLQYFPGRNFPDPLANYMGGFNLFWYLDIWRELRNARDAAIQRYNSTLERRNFFVTRLVAEISENYFALMALDKRIENLDKTIELQEQSLKIAKDKMDAGRGTVLAVQRFQAEVRKNQSEKLIVRQEIVEVENRINFLANRYPQQVERMSAKFFELNMQGLSLGLPSEMLQYRPDVRQAERELEAAGLDVKVARAHFFPRLSLSAGIGYQAFNLKYLFTSPEALIGSVAGDLTAPLINKAAIKAEYLTANAKQLETVYNYQRVVLNAFTEVVNRVSMAENYRKSIEMKQQQLQSLEASVKSASELFDNARVEYIEVLFAQRDLLEARMVLIDTKRQQLSAIVNTYQALGGGDILPDSSQDLGHSRFHPRK